jgi:ABC-type uncharacterized transport system ATPase subunit
LSIIEFHGVNKFFGDFQVLEDIEFSVEEGARTPRTSEPSAF